MARNRRSDDVIVTGGHVRYFLQRGSEVGAAPTNPTEFCGNRTQFFYLDSITNPRRGSITPIRMHDPNRLKAYIKVGSTIEAPEDPESDMVFTQRHGGIPVQLYDLGDCPFTVYQPVGKCRMPGNFDQGWSDYVKVLANGLTSDADEGGQGGWTNDEPLEDTLTVTWERVYVYGQLQSSQVLSTNAPGDIVGIAYAGAEACTTCSQGIENIYVVNSFGELWYSTDKGITWTSFGAIDTIFAANGVATHLAVVGDQLIVSFIDTTPGDGGYFLSTLDLFTGEPGAFTMVQGGFEDDDGATYIWALSATEVFFLLNGNISDPIARIGKATNLQVGVETVLASVGANVGECKKIDGRDDIVVAAGFYLDKYGHYSLDRGQTWTEFPTIPPLSGDYAWAVAVLSRYRWWLGGEGGELVYTINGGITWESVSLATANGPVTRINDIQFVNDEIGYILAADDIYGTGDNTLFYTTNGGYTWRYSGQRLAPNTIGPITVMALPDAAPRESVAANNLVVGVQPVGVGEPEVWLFRGAVI